MLCGSKILLNLNHKLLKRQKFVCVCPVVVVVVGGGHLLSTNLRH